MATISGLACMVCRGLEDSAGLSQADDAGGTHRCVKLGFAELSSQSDENVPLLWAGFIFESDAWGATSRAMARR